MADATVLRLRVTLRGVEPPIWRRVDVPAGMTLRQLHEVVQDVMGWTRSHLHEFEIGSRRFGAVDDDAPVELLDDRDVTIDEALQAGEALYLYDFGDEWSHDIVVEDRFDAPGDAAARCVAGERACPPEDVGGARGYEQFLEAIADPDHEQHDELVEWWGGPFDPEHFDLAAAQPRRRSQRVRR